jgi:hypothetical protein
MNFKLFLENDAVAMKILSQQDVIDMKFIQEIDKLKGSIMEFVGNRFSKNLGGTNQFSTIATMANKNNGVINHLSNLAEIDVQILDFLYSARIINFNQILRSIPETFSELTEMIERISDRDLVPDLTQTKNAIDYSLNKIKTNASKLLKNVNMNNELLKISLANPQLFSYLYKFNRNETQQAEEFITNVATWYETYVPRFIDICSNYVHVTIQNLNVYVVNQSE